MRDLPDPFLAGWFPPLFSFLSFILATRPDDDEATTTTIAVGTHSFNVRQRRKLPRTLSAVRYGSFRRGVIEKRR